uniref:Uncharacterized protein n=1 Tax=Arundo donax TaxID=35708 RepID=A0A0A9BUU3_ARUDO
MVMGKRKKELEQQVDGGPSDLSLSAADLCAPRLAGPWAPSYYGRTTGYFHCIST